MVYRSTLSRYLSGLTFTQSPNLRNQAFRYYCLVSRNTLFQYLCSDSFGMLSDDFHPDIPIDSEISENRRPSNFLAKAINSDSVPNCIIRFIKLRPFSIDRFINLRHSHMICLSESSNYSQEYLGFRIGLEGPPESNKETNTQSSGVTNGSQVQRNNMLLKCMLKGGD